MASHEQGPQGGTRCGTGVPAGDSAGFGSNPALVRSWSAVVLAGCLAVLAVACVLKPDARGFGTHEQLGLAPCNMFDMTGLPCPTCGMTTAFAHTVRGHFGAAFLAQPSGLALALATIVASIVCVCSLFTGRLPIWVWIWLTPYRMLFVMLLIFVAGWALKIAMGLVSGQFPVRPG